MNLKCLAALPFALAASFSNAQNISVEITNLTHSIFFTPILVSAHADGMHLLTDVLTTVDIPSPSKLSAGEWLGFSLATGPGPGSLHAPRRTRAETATRPERELRPRWRFHSIGSGSMGDS